jgi:Signal transduction histidine kinase
MLLNLLANAIKYSPDSDSIEVFTDNNKDLAIIKVKDHGIGIDSKDHTGYSNVFTGRKVKVNKHFLVLELAFL